MYFFQIPWQFDAWPIYQRTFGINSNGFQGKKGITKGKILKGIILNRQSFNSHNIALLPGFRIKALHCIEVVSLLENSMDCTRCWRQKLNSKEDTSHIKHCYSDANQWILWKHTPCRLSCWIWNNKPVIIKGYSTKSKGV